MHSTTPNNADSSQDAGQRAVGFPRRYGLRTLLIVTAIYAVLFAFLASIEAHAVGFVVPALFLGGVGAAQVLLFKGTRPREASLVAGSCLVTALMAVVVVVGHVLKESGDASLLWTVVLAPALGAGLGYLVGGAIAGPFLIAKWLRARRGIADQRPGSKGDLPKP